MAAYTLLITIDKDQFLWLKKNHYELCISKKTNGAYTVIWDTLDYAENSNFGWEESYKTFWTNTYEAGLLIQESCTPMPIAFGQNVVITSNSNMNPATGTPDASGKFTVTNKYPKGVHVAVASKVEGGEYKACYVSPDETGTNYDSTLEPITTVTVWFEEHAKSNSMISKIKGANLEVVYGGTTTHTAHYGGTGTGEWTLSS